ncbi:chemotaxis protein CheA [Halomonas binhaiensis]|uniref:Chemotaxis protein CheA n=1 Tax=Halomonas binhaiensis TaxID=2562282 RepID=A0A5C1NMP8_9GAMM|nr:chemotaxis protein CheA [Halomonas binhaiensis]QEM83793.1 chemotaxis protein CheA [Halomonas binhaiensis]
MDIQDFSDTFFEEAEELLADMEGHLLALDPDVPDIEQLNAIFRAAHSIKGGAGTFGFEALQRTTHLLENLLDHARRGELKLRGELIDAFLATKDELSDQLAAYRHGTTPDQAAFEQACHVLNSIADQEIGDGQKTSGTSASESSATSLPSAQAPQAAQSLIVTLNNVSEQDIGLLIEELGQLGDIVEQHSDADQCRVVLATTEDADAIEAVMCFIVEPEQVSITPMASTTPTPVDKVPATDTPPSRKASSPAIRPAKAKPAQENGSIRVAVDKVDQIINLVGELIITQSMLDQTVSELQGNEHAALLGGMSLLQRNARDLQEAVMSIRMVPMDYVFSRFPRLVRDLASKLGKQIELVTEGESTELDKSLTERIIDPLTHLVRNSLDHGIELPDARAAAGKPSTGRLTLSAQHQGGNILIEVMDDGTGLNRERILAKASESGLNVSDAMSDEEVWQLIFAPGFSTAAEISDVSGRGVGMDVVKRNIQAMGGHVEILSRPGQGTTTRIVLPLTLAILDGMSIRAGKETFILPLSAVIESLQPAKQDLYAITGDDLVLKVRDEYLPIVTVHEALDVDGACTEPTEAIAVIVQGEGRRYALLVDDLIGQQQVVVKNLETNYRRVPGVSAATILGDGSVALILDITDLHRLHRHKKATLSPGQHDQTIPAFLPQPPMSQEMMP